MFKIDFWLRRRWVPRHANDPIEWFGRDHFLTWRRENRSKGLIDRWVPGRVSNGRERFLNHLRWVRICWTGHLSLSHGTQSGSGCTKTKQPSRRPTKSLLDCQGQGEKKDEESPLLAALYSYINQAARKTTLKLAFVLTRFISLIVKWATYLNVEDAPATPYDIGRECNGTWSHWIYECSPELDLLFLLYNHLILRKTYPVEFN